MPLDVRWAHSLWSSTRFCVLCGGPNKPSLVQAFKIASFGPIEASSTLPVPRPYCCSCPRVVKATSLHRSMYVPYNFASPQDIWKKKLPKICISFSVCSCGFLQPMAPRSSCSPCLGGGEQRRGSHWILVCDSLQACWLSLIELG